MAKKSCKKGYYWCRTDEKCKKIPKGWHVMPTGYLMRDSEKHSDEEETKKKNGNGTNGNGNGNGDSSGSSDGGGVSEGWSAKYKRSIDCDNPKGFSQRAHCQGRKKVNEAKGYEGDHEVSMAQSQLKKSEKNIKMLRKALGKKEKNIPAWVQAKITDTEHNTDAAAGYMDEAKKCWKGYEKKGTQKLFGKTYNRCVKKEETCPICNEDPCQCLEGTINEARKSGDYSLRDWFSKSRASDGTPGWVQLGGKYAGKPCAKQPGQKTKPKCGSSKMAAELSDKEEESAFLRKNRQDKNPNRRGKAKNVATEKKKKLNASYSNWRQELEDLNEFLGGKPGDGYIGHPNLDIKNPFAKKQTKKEVLPGAKGGGLVQRTGAGIGDVRMRQNAEIQRLLRQSNELEGEMVSEGDTPRGKKPKVGDTITSDMTQPPKKPSKWGVDKTGKEGPEKPLGEEKDACYHKVKSRYKIWPSAYASGALVKCRKVGAKNWGNKSEGYILEFASRRTIERMRREAGGSFPSTTGRNLPPAPGSINPTTGEKRPASPLKKVKEGYEFSNWRDDFQALEFETINIIEAKPLKDKKDACKGKPKRWQDSDCDGKWYEKGEDVKEDWQKTNRKDGVDGMSQKAVNAYRRENPGSKLKTAVTEKNPTGKRAERRKNFCSRSNGQRKMHNIDCSATPEKKICKARKRWRC